MQRVKLLLACLVLAAALAAWGYSGRAVAAETLAQPSKGQAQAYTAYDAAAPGADDDKPGKNDKGNNEGKGNKDKDDDKGNNGNKNNQDDKAKDNQGARGNSDGQGNGEAAGRPDFGVWWRNFSARPFGGPSALVQGGWQLGRFKDAFPFSTPPGWAKRERGDALLLTGFWQGGEYVFQMTRSVQVGARSLEDWVAGDLQRMRLAGMPVRYVQSGNTRIAVVTGVKDPDYTCPVAYVYLWASNPAGSNQRQALGVVSQVRGAACNLAALNGFVDAYLAQLKNDEGRSPEDAPRTTPVATAVATAAPTRAATTPAPAAGWQGTRFFNAFSFAYPQGWTMDRLGDTAHLQGEYRGRQYVVDMVWVRGAPQVGLEQWARADLTDLGVNMDGVRLDYVSQGNQAQVAVASGVRMLGYRCPVVRMYVVAPNTASGGQRAYTVTVGQTNGGSCDPQALENLAFQMLQQV